MLHIHGGRCRFYLGSDAQATGGWPELSLCGIPYWNTDLGGFFAWKYNNDVNNIAYHELHVRWYQWGAFQPIMRSHNSSPVAVEIYQFGDKGDWAYDALEKYTLCVIAYYLIYIVLLGK